MLKYLIYCYVDYFVANKLSLCLSGVSIFVIFGIGNKLCCSNQRSCFSLPRNWGTACPFVKVEGWHSLRV